MSQTAVQPVVGSSYLAPSAPNLQGVAPLSTANAANTRDRVVALLARYAPHRLNEINFLMDNCRGQESALIEALVFAYGPEPVFVSPANRVAAYNPVQPLVPFQNTPQRQHVVHPRGDLGTGRVKDLNVETYYSAPSMCPADPGKSPNRGRLDPVKSPVRSYAPPTTPSATAVSVTSEPIYTPTTHRQPYYHQLHAAPSSYHQGPPPQRQLSPSRVSPTSPHHPHHYSYLAGAPSASSAFLTPSSPYTTAEYGAPPPPTSSDYHAYRLSGGSAYGYDRSRFALETAASAPGNPPYYYYYLDEGSRPGAALPPVNTAAAASGAPLYATASVPGGLPTPVRRYPAVTPPATPQYMSALPPSPATGAGDYYHYSGGSSPSSGPTPYYYAVPGSSGHRVVV